jgi:EXPERA (EXPanded EBP superfamily)
MSTVFGIIFDPTVLFTLGCLAVGPALAYVDDPTTFAPKFVDYVTDPAMIAGVCALFAAVVIGGRWASNFSGSERRTALWYLINGAFIHITMDGMTGGHHFLSLLNSHYTRMDIRFKEDESVSWMITQIELFVMAPLCVAAYRYVVRHPNSGARWALELLTSTFHLWGAVIFWGSEVLNGFVNLPDYDRDFKFEFDHCLYFWFGFFANLVWVVIPLALIIRAFRRIAQLTSHGKKKKN